MFARLAVPQGNAVDALDFGPRAFMTRHGWSTHTITFPPVPASADRAELHLGVDGKEWRVPIALRRTRVGAWPVAVESRDAGMIVRVTAVAREGDAVMVGLECEGEDPRTLLGSIGQGPPPMLPPLLKAPRNWASSADALLLTDDRGGRAYERTRLTHADLPRGLRDPQPPRRMTSTFGPVHPDAASAVVRVPWIEVSELDGSAEVDLAVVPATAEVNGHRFESCVSSPRCSRRTDARS